MRPADPDDILAMLGPVLALVGASGMSHDDRTEWLAAAVDTLREYPFDLLHDAIRECRRRADHPSKVIPAVCDYCDDPLAWRKQELQRAEYAARAAEHPAQPILPDNNNRRCPGEEASQIIDELIPWVRNGTERVNEPTDRGPPRMPTRADYIALGVDPAVLPGRK